MSDNPKKKKLDGKRISRQPWEQAYQRRKKRNNNNSILPPPKRSQTNPGKASKFEHLFTHWHNPAAATLQQKKRLECAVAELEGQVLAKGFDGKKCIPFCQEWEKKGKPIFTMVLELFTFRPKTQAIIRRIMDGMDRVCKASEVLTQ